MTDTELFEPLGVADLDFHVTKSIDQCPPFLQQRELVKNGIEAELLVEEEGRRRILLRGVPIDGVQKLSVFNTGRGMTAEELRLATDLSSSIRKDHGLAGRKNRGEGAKVASLPWNHDGVRFRSCCEGGVSETLLKRIGDRYVRVREKIENDDGSSDYDSVWDVTEDVLADGAPVDVDWTEVVCLGQSADQDTTRYPYGPSIGAGVQRVVLSEIFDRFYSVPDWVSLEADESLHGRRGVTRFRLLSDGIEHWGADYAKLRAERVQVLDGVEIQFVHLPTLGGSNNVFGGHELAGNAPRIALVWQGEMYDAKIGPEWKKIGASFGLPYVHGQVTVLIHLPDDAPVKEGAYRVDLLWDQDSSKIEVEHFQSEVRQAMPPWLKELVDEATRPRRASDMSLVRAELERRLKLALVRVGEHDRVGSRDPISPRPGSSQRKLLDETGSGIAGAGGEDVDTKLDREDREPPERTLLDPDAPIAPPSERRPQQPRKPAKKRRAVQLVSNAPDIVWLDKPEQIESEALLDRAAKYDQATNVLFLNGLYGAVAGKLSDLEVHYRGLVDWEQVQELVLERVRAEMALHIGSVVVHALSKQRVKSWLPQDLSKALATESLTVAADQSEHLLGEIRTTLSRIATFQAAKTPEPA